VVGEAVGGAVGLVVGVAVVGDLVVGETVVGDSVVGDVVGATVEGESDGACALVPPPTGTVTVSSPPHLTTR